MRAPVPAAERERLAAVRAHHGLLPGDDVVLTTITGLAVRATGAGAATVTLVGGREVAVVAATGVPGVHRPRAGAVCVCGFGSDAAVHVPLHDAAGAALGALCVVDARPLDLDTTRRAVLADLAVLAEQHLAHLRAAAPTPVVAGSDAVGRGTRSLDVLDGLAAGEFVPFYQPIVRLSDGAVVGVEALVRWEHPTQGLLPPGAFLPAAEADHVVLALDALVLEEACTQVQHWRCTRPAAAELELSVNVSGHHLQEGCLATLVESALAASGLPAAALTLELTETVLVASGDAATVARLQAVRDLGVGLALDDFGTGHSTLTYLRRFPVTRLKVDRSFVRGLGVDRRDALLVEHVVGLARGLGLDVVGEGVETPHQAAVLRDLGCGKGQGVHFQRPVAAEQLEASGRLGRLGPLATVGRRPLDRAPSWPGPDAGDPAPPPGRVPSPASLPAQAARGRAAC